jgi:hypothetical protein
VEKTIATQDRRSEPRFQVSLPGHIFLSDGQVQLACRIIDLSVGGACIELASDCTLPVRVQLHESKQDNAFECEVRWQKQRTAGLLFVDVCTRAVRKRMLAGILAEQERERSRHAAMRVIALTAPR